MDIATLAEQPTRSICFVTNEVYPIHKGGIGRLMYNFAVHNHDCGGTVECHLLLPSSLAEKLPEIEAALDGLAIVHACRPLGERPEEIARLVAASPEDAWDASRLYRQSLEYFFGLLDVAKQRGAPFTIIEFPDFGGFATASVAAKRTGLAFGETLLSARLHSSLGLIATYEKYYHHPSLWLGCILDAERELLAHADLIVGHVPAIAKLNARHYRFGDAWAERVRIEFPFIGIDQEREGIGAVSLVPPEEPDFVFSSRLQPFKRPDLFVKAAVMFLEENPDYLGTFWVVAYGWDTAYIQTLKDLVPKILQRSIRFESEMSPLERQQILRNAVVVIPSDFESLCLFAYEASQLGAKVILNRRCEAFGAFERWQEGENCLMFDGSAVDLAATMERAVSWIPAATALTDADPPYWLDTPPPPPPPVAPLPTMSLCCYGFDEPADAHRTLLSLRSIDALDDVVATFFLPRAGMGPGSAVADMVRGLSVHYLSGHGRCPEEFGRLLLEVESEIIVLLPPGYQLHPRYLRLVRRVMAQSPQLGICSTHVRQLDPQNGARSGIAIYAGDMPSLALQDDVVAPPVLAVRRSVLETVPFDDRAGPAWQAVWLRQAVLQGVQVAIVPVVGVDALVPGSASTNSLRISGAIIDEVGLAHGMASRLLSLEPQNIADATPQYLLRELRGDALRAADQVWPTPKATPRDFPLVAYRPQHQGLLVHPVTGSAVVARFLGPPGAIRLLEVDVANMHAENHGVEVAVAICAAAEIDEALAESFALGRPPAPHLMSPWELVEPDSQMTIKLHNLTQSRRTQSVLVMTRVPKGYTDTYCHLIARSVRLHFVGTMG